MNPPEKKRLPALPEEWVVFKAPSFLTGFTLSLR